MRVAVLLGILLVACATTRPTTKIWVGDCIERVDPYTDSICWGTLDDLSADLGHWSLVNVRCNGAMKGFRRATIYLSRHELSDFSQSVRCERKRL